MQTYSETIVATATPPGRGGVAIIRISGPHVIHIAEKILGVIPLARYAHYSHFLDHEGQILDKGIALYFPAPNSFTGEDVLELHGHGGPTIVDCLIRRILSLGARLARSGEFSERAFLNNKMDLLQAEAIADLIDASSEQAARAAMRSLQGEFSSKINSLVESLIRLRTYVEAAIDFSEEDIDFLAAPQVTNELIDIIERLVSIQKAAKQGSLLRDGITAVIAGQPNVGKSSLLNQLSGRETAIVTDIAGTTRDVLREYILMDGMPIHVIDTAGLRESADIVEQEGVRRAYHEIKHADFILFVTDENRDSDNTLNNFIGNLSPATHLVNIRNKIDLLHEKPSCFQDGDKTIISLSAKTGEGIELLKAHIKTHMGFQTSSAGVFSARRRHLDALERADNFLQSAKKQLHSSCQGELLAEDLRQAQLALNEITGEFTSDDLLGKIFSSFCIGK